MGGIYKTQIEDYRLLIPEELKDFFTDEIYVITKGLGIHNSAIFLYKEDAWNQFVEKLESLPKEDSKVRNIKRYFRGSATDAEMENNTISVPEFLLSFLCSGKGVQTIDVQMYFGERFGCPLVIEIQEG